MIPKRLYLKLKKIDYTIPDGRKVEITFTNMGIATIVTEKFDPEKENTNEVQKEGWQSILNNFKKYVENN